MRQRSRFSAPVILVVAILSVGSGDAVAQSASRRQLHDPFIRTRHGVFNTNQIERVQFGVQGTSSRPMATLYFVGRPNAIVLIGEDNLRHDRSGSVLKRPLLLIEDTDAGDVAR